MRRRHPPPLPTRWLFTDERMGHALWAALARLPRGAGVVFRHHATPPPERLALARRVAATCRRRGLALLLGGAPLPLRTDGVHARRDRQARLLTMPVHDLREIRRAERAGADLLFLSPVFATRSHPGAPTLGPLRFAALARATRLPVVALGGMDARRARRVPAAHGWAAIDAWVNAWKAAKA